MSEGAAATNGQLSAPYLHALRSGRIEKPGLDKMRLLADFFGVDLNYFSPPSAGEPPSTGISTEMERAVRQAMEQPLLREISLGVGELDDEEQLALLTLINKARARAARDHEAREGASSEADGPPSEGGS